MMYKELDSFIGGDLVGYKKITEMCGLSYQKGNGKEAQIKDIGRYFEIEKVKTKYRFIKRYDMPLEREDGRQSDYYEDLKTVILYALDGSGSSMSVNWSTGKALQLANFVNKNFQYCNDKTINDVSAALEVDKYYVYDFYNVSKTKFKGIFDTVLNSMQRKGIIDWHECTMVCKRVSSIALNSLGEPIIDSNGIMEYNITKEYREATIEERSAINKAKVDILKDLEVDNTGECFKKGKWNKFKKAMNKRLSAELNIDFYYKGYSIVKNSEYIHEIVTKLNKDSCAANVNFRALTELKNSTNAKLTRDVDSRDVLLDILIDDGGIPIRELIKNMTMVEEELERDLFPF